MKSDDLANRFAFHAADTVKREQHGYIRDACHLAARELNDLVPDSRELSTAISHLEDAMMWANAGLARHDSGHPALRI